MKNFYKKSDKYFISLNKNRNINTLPRLEKIVLHLHAGKILNSNNNFLRETYPWFAKIGNQKPQIILSKKANADFNIKKKMEVGLKMDLRHNRMLNFYKKFIYINSCKIVNFRGFDENFDGHGNLNIGIKDAFIFPEVEYDKIKSNFGFDINFITNIQDDKTSKKFFTLLNFKFKKK